MSTGPSARLAQGGFVLSAALLLSALQPGTAWAAEGATPPEQAVLVYLKLSDAEFGTEQEREKIFALEDALTAAVEQQNTGEFDGNEFGDGFGTLYLYGPDADKLALAILPALQAWEAPGSYLIKRYGEPGAREERVELRSR